MARETLSPANCHTTRTDGMGAMASPSESHKSNPRIFLCCNEEVENIMASLLSATAAMIDGAIIQESSALAFVFPRWFNETATRVPPVFNINCGGRPNNRFVSDDSSWIIGLTSSFGKPADVIGGAEEKNRPIYKSFRYAVGGDIWGYNIPVSEPGLHACTVQFTETLS